MIEQKALIPIKENIEERKYLKSGEFF